MYSGIVLVAIFLAGFADANTYSEVLQCYTKHLQNIGMLDSNSSKDELSSLCEFFLKVFENTFNDEIDEILRDTNIEKLDKECYIDYLKYKRYSDYVLREKVYHERNESEIKITDNIDEYENINIRATVQCTSNEFKNLFNLLYLRNPNAKEDLEHEYCMTLYVVLKGLVDPKYLLNIIPNLNLDTHIFDCYAKGRYIRQGLNGLISTLIKKDSNKECATQLYDAYDFVRQSILVTVFRHFNPNDEQLAEFRNKYLDMMTTISIDEVLYCSTNSTLEMDLIKTNMN